MITNGPQLDAPLDGALPYPAKLIDEFAWETDLPDAADFRGNTNARRIGKEPVGVVGAIVPWNFPFEVTSTSWARPWPPATPWCSSRRPTRRGTPPSSAASSPSRPTSRPACSTS